MINEPIRVFPEKEKGVLEYGSYVSGYHATRDEAIQVATLAAQVERRELVIDTKA